MSSPKHASRQPLPLRRIAREVALQFLYQHDVGSVDKTNVRLIEQFWNQLTEERPELGDKEWRKVRPQAQALIDGVKDHVATLDPVIIANADNWSIERMAVVDRNILRLAVFELQYHLDVPPAVAINEAVEIAKLFGGEESSRFINGILDSIRRRLPSITA